ncbi:hypothetical protein [Polyangium sp. 15x6]|uniref:hypothetical protein n=1 Tax=Polyangium sp. 15x6 TaxID=3042687 RepID=UPI00249B93B4|nr:hypothetical protein [Polyangium sp. 15x6]MDI3282124.1 hypothetical protein [Polyangium sp. 15x6]
MELFRKYQALYQGGRLFRDLIGVFLPKNEYETPQVYAIRQRDASYRSYVGPIIDFYASQLFSAPYAIRATRGEEQVELDDYYALLKEDIDTQGTDLTTFFKSRFTQALVKGVSYWVAEFPMDGGPEPVTRDEWVARGLDRARLCPVDADAVHDWECDPTTGDYAWVKTFSHRFFRPSPAAETLCIDTWTIYDAEGVEVYELRYDPKKRPKGDTEVPLVASYPHGFPRVPILSLRMPEGLWLLDRAADAQVEHFRLSAALGWSLRRSAYAMGVFKLKDAQHPPQLGAGFGILLGQDDSFEFAEPAGSSMTVLRDEISSQKDEIYRVSQQMAMSVDNNASALGRSGLSKMADSSAQEICLRGYATLVKEAIERTFELLSDARGDVDTKFSIEGMSQFNVVDATTLVANAQAAKALGIPSPTFHKELNYRVAEALLPMDVQQKTKDDIRREIESAPDEKNSPAAPEPNQGPEDEQDNGSKSRTSPSNTPFDDAEV